MSTVYLRSKSNHDFISSHIHPPEFGLKYLTEVFSRISGICGDFVRASNGFVLRPRSLVQFGLGSLRIIWSEFERVVALAPTLASVLVATTMATSPIYMASLSHLSPSMSCGSCARTLMPGLGTSRRALDVSLNSHILTSLFRNH